VSSEEPLEPPIVVTDKRRINPDGDTPIEVVVEDVVADVVVPDKEAELLADLQRVSAEYANYRKRVDRDRVTVIEMAVSGVLEGLLPLLDSVELARQHGDLEGPFKGVGEGLEQLAERHGLERYTEVGDAFDPAVHDALMQAPENPEASVPTVAQVLQPGWRVKDGRVLRHASVAVAEPGRTPEE